MPDAEIKALTNPLDVSDKAYDDFWTWAKEYYGRGQWNYGWGTTDITPYYEYWTQYLWNPKHPLETPPPAGEAPVGTTPTIWEESLNPPKFEKSLPDKIKIGADKLPVNYAPVYTTTALVPGIDPVTGAEVMVEKPLTFYAPVVELGTLNDKAIEDIYNSMYAVFNDGTLYEGGRPLTRDELQDYIPFDPVKGTLTKEGKATLLDDVAYASMTQWAQENIQPTITPEMDKYLTEQAKNWGKGIAATPDVLQQDLEKMTAVWQMEHPGEERKRLIEGYGNIPATAEQDAQRAAAIEQSFKGAPPAGVEGSEIEQLQATMKYYQRLYDEYVSRLEREKANIAAGKPPPGGLSSTEQTRMIGARVYDMAKQRLAAIQGGALPTIGKAGQFDPGQSKRLAEIAQELGVPYGQVAAIGQKYLGQPEHPEFGKLQPVEKTRLIEAGRIVQGQTFEEPDPLEAAQKLKATEEAAYQALLKKARQQPNQPQRLARL